MSLNPARTCWKIFKGKTFKKRLVLKDSTGTVINLTGRTFFLEAKEKLTDTAKVIDLSIGSGITVTALSGLIEIEIDETVTDTYTQDILYFTFYQIDSGDEQPLILGTFEIEVVA